ncbi:hypothetical protein [Acinetobacter sp. YH16032]|uniref:hypothetical protein n=1 Tax=Acinetobacter sp. YH16032 TaxID=2601181 RepID=UPI001C555099|nr:hypothetical protein [Acinetobacter sp. YH16032]
MNKKNIFLVILIFVICAVILWVYLKSTADTTQSISNQNNNTSTLKSNEDRATSLSENSADMKLNTNLPVWAKKLLQLDQSAANREEKIHDLIQLLEQNQHDENAIEEILTQLTSLNPLEAAEQILPFLTHQNPKIQSLAIGALNNAMLLTDREHELKKSLPENDLIRQKISRALEQRFQDPNLDPKVKQVLISSLPHTASVQTQHNLAQELLQQNSISPNEAQFLSQYLLNGQGNNTTLEQLTHKNPKMIEDIIANLNNQIVDQPAIVEVLNNDQKKQLHNFILQHPPSSKDESYGYKNDIWRFSLNQLQQ